MIQYVEEPTHISGNLLDLIISNEANMVQGERMEGRLVTSDHKLIEADIRLETRISQATVSTRDYTRGDYVEMRRRMECINWDLELESLGIEETRCLSKRKLTEMTEALVPLRKKRRSGAPPWMDGEIRKAIKEKKKAWNKWKRTKQEEAKKEYKRWETKTKKLIRNRKNRLERQIAKDCKTNPKRFYSFINSSRRSCSMIGPLFKDGVQVVDPKHQAEYLNDYFSSVFSRCSTAPLTKDPIGTTKISDIEVNEMIVKDAIDRTHEFSAPGPEDMTNKIIIELKNEIAKPLAVLFRKSLDESRIPADWRLSNVTPVFKKGSKSEPGNYRPISLTSNICKLMERVVNV